jgi:hypothetical protein
MENTSMKPLLKSLQDQYLKGDFESVKEGLLEHKTSFPKGEFHYNLGTVYSKMNNHAVARFHLEKALDEGYENVAVKHNLKSVQGSLGVSDVSNSNRFEDLALSKSLEFGNDFYLFLTLLLAVTALVLLLKRYVSKSSFAILALIAVIPISVKTFYIDKFSVGILFQESVIYEGPSGIFEKTGKVPAGSKIILGKKTDGWRMIEKPLEYVGWIKSNEVGVIK